MRKIIHIDVDAFFASVEILDNPSLKGKPVIVGGKNSRGVVTTCSYEARKYGVRSAMPGFIAQRLCPNGIFVKPRFERYKEISQRIFDIFYGITHLVEPLSIDEAYLDVSEIDMDEMEIGRYIKDKVKDEVGISVSVGVSYNKFLAKIASDWNKPDGIMQIKPEMVPIILYDLPIGKVYGIGKKTSDKLKNIGISKVEDLLKLSLPFMREYLGRSGEEIYFKIRGIDERRVDTSREIKSIGRETTLRTDTTNEETLNEYIELFAKNISRSLIRKKLKGKTVTIKIKYSDFKLITRGRSLDRGTCDFEEILSVAKYILEEIDLSKEVRLIGLTLSNLKEVSEEQLDFF